MVEKNAADKSAVDVHGDFAENVDLHHVIGQRKTVQKLQMAISQSQWDVLEGREETFRSLFLSGKTSDTLARACSNSLGNTYYEVHAELIGMGLDIGDFFLQGSQCSTYHLKDVDRLSRWAIHRVSLILKDRVLSVPEIVGRRKERKVPYDRFLILSSHNHDSVHPSIMENIDVYCFLEEYSRDDILAILSQRAGYLKWSIESPKILEAIADVCKNNVGLAIDLLSWTHRCARSRGEHILKIADLNRALHLLN